MSSMQVLDQDGARETHPPAPVESREVAPFGITPPAARRAGIGLSVLGLASVAVVAIGLVGPRLLGPAPDSDAEPPPQPRELVTVVDAATVHTSGPAELSLQRVTYGPGESSGWHIHPGMHLVSIMSGTLTVYGADCQPQTFGPGQPYIGGEQRHVARNETDAPLEMAVTYVARPGQSMQHFRIDASAPPNCSIS